MRTMRTTRTMRRTPMADDVRRCDYCGTPDPLPEGTGYRCGVCGEWWRPEDDEDVEDEPE
jgi:DNA-directed RNA polymerase subunit RPC12/RpoP